MLHFVCLRSVLVSGIMQIIDIVMGNCDVIHTFIACEWNQIVCDTHKS